MSGGRALYAKLLINMLAKRHSAAFIPWGCKNPIMHPLRDQHSGSGMGMYAVLCVTNIGVKVTSKERNEAILNKVKNRCDIIKLT